MAISEKELMELEFKQKQGIKLSKEEKSILKENSQEEKAKKSKMSFGERMKLASKTSYAQLMGDSEEDNFPIRDFISTGNALFNSQISGRYDKGLPSGRVAMFCGSASTGKTFLALETAKQAQKLGYFVILYDSEMANNEKEALKARGINTEQMLYIPIDTVENLKTSLLNILDETSPSDKVIVILDSIGNLSTNKEVEDSMEGSTTKDLTRPAQLKALFRTVTIQAGVKNVPIVAINHTYACATENMLVIMSDGSNKPINKITQGDYVQTIVGNKEVIDLFEYDVNEYIQLTLEDGTILEVTDQHKFLTQNLEWKQVSQLNEGDIIINNFSV